MKRLNNLSVHAQNNYKKQNLGSQQNGVIILVAIINYISIKNNLHNHNLTKASVINLTLM